jgi:hypothetical protein
MNFEYETTEYQVPGSLDINESALYNLDYIAEKLALNKKLLRHNARRGIITAKRVGNAYVISGKNLSLFIDGE